MPARYGSSPIMIENRSQTTPVPCRHETLNGDNLFEESCSDFWVASQSQSAAIPVAHSEGEVPESTHPNGNLGQVGFESLDYERPSPDEQANGHQVSLLAKQKRSVLRWLLTALVGFLTGLCACLLDLSCGLLSKWRNNVIGTEDGFSIGGVIVFTVWNALLVAGAGWVAIFVAPASIGSGIPEVKAYLNGVSMNASGLFSTRTYIAKFIGVVMAYSSGFMVGPEGPLVHLGAITGHAATSGREAFWMCRSPGSCRCSPSSWVNDRERRDFVSVGAAAGFAVAFGSPVGGVLFALEELASFWSPALMWRTLSATLMGTISLLVFDSVFMAPRDDTAKPWVSINTGLITLSGGDQVRMTEVPLFVVLGIFGGLFGATFNKIFEIKMTTFKNASLSRRQRLVALIAISVTTSLLLFSLPPLFGAETCRPQDHFDQSSKGSDNVWIRFGCNDDEVNVLASIFMGSRSDAIRVFLEEPNQFSLGSLGVMFLIFFPLTIAAFGQDISGGVFLPSILNGSCMGALFGKTVCKFIVYAEPDLVVEHCALVGAVAMLAGILRSGVSLCVIVMEGTGRTELILPAAIVTVVARGIGRLFTEGLYEVSMRLKSIPFLSASNPAKHSQLEIKMIMNSPPVTISAYPTVMEIRRLLRSNNHNGFPVVSQDGHLHGVVLRRGLWRALRSIRIASYREEESEDDEDAGSFNFDDQCTNDFDAVDIDEFIDVGCHTVFWNCTIARAYCLFQTLGLRHVPVISQDGKVVGMLTRKSFVR